MNLLFFDTETTGIQAGDPKTHLTQLSFILTDSAGEELFTFNSYLKPEGWEVPREEFFLNQGITTEMLHEKGAHHEQVIKCFVENLRKADVLIAHNIIFDLRIMTREIIRVHPKLEDDAPLSSIDITKRQGKTPRLLICTMKETTDLCKIPHANGRGHKWPKLEELYNFLFQESFENAHDGLADNRAMKRCFFELVEKFGFFQKELA